MKADENFSPRRFDYDFSVHYRHFERYMQAIKVLGRLGKNQTWLDCACGTGYGSQLLSGFADRVVGYDINTEAIAEAKANSCHDRCLFYADKHHIAQMVFDAVISVETIEHMARADAVPFLQFLQGLMKESALLVITTPLVPLSNPNPTNPFHFYEYCHDEFVSVLEESGFRVDHCIKHEVTFTDGETKEQGVFRCLVNR